MRQSGRTRFPDATHPGAAPDCAAAPRRVAVHESDRPGLRVADPLGSCAGSVAGKHGVDEDPHECAEQVGAERGKSAKLEGQRQNPLTDRHRRDDSIHDPGSDIAHAPSGAARANAAAFARERDEQVMAARLAAAMNKPKCKYSASQIAAQLLLDVVWQRRVIRLAGVCEEALEVGTYDPVKHRLGGSPGAIGWCESSHGVRKAARVPTVWSWIFRRIVARRGCLGRAYWRPRTGNHRACFGREEGAAPSPMPQFGSPIGRSRRGQSSSRKTRAVPFC
jgi:hypothetical protein